MKDSIFRAGIRAFFITICIMIGIGVGFIPLVVGIGAASGAGSEELQYGYSHEILPNANGDRKVAAKDAPVILSIPIEGIIGLEFLNRHTIEKQLTESREGVLKDRVKGILLVINSPGGTVVDAAEIMHHLNNYKKKFGIPIYAHVDGICASGAMYAASSADKIYASEISLIGSVGVISPPIFNFSKGLEKLGIESTTIFEGKGKDSLNMFRPWKPDETASFKKITESYYRQFVRTIVESRPKITRDELVNTLGAHLFPADRALEIGFIDGNEMSRADTMKLLLEEMNIQDDSYQVIELESRNWLSQLIKGEHPLLEGKIKHEFTNLPIECDARLQGQFLALYRP